MTRRCLLQGVGVAVLLLSHAAMPVRGQSASEARRVATYDEALELARAAGSDIVVFQRGSDWNRLGERLLADVWNASAFARAVGDGAILVVVDRAEAIGAPPVKGECPEDVDPAAEPRPAGSPLERLRGLAEEKHPPPSCDVVSLEAADSSVFQRQPDGSYLAEGANPAQETLSLTLKARGGGRVLRFDFPLHDSLPGRGPGRASNGNFAIGEVELDGPDGSPIKLTAAWANASEGAWGPWQALDGIADKDDNLWNPAAHHHQRRTLLLVLEKPLRAGATANVRLVCRSKWGQHVPGHVRAAVISDDSLASDILAVAKAELNNARNGRFTWRGETIPRVAVLDSEGRPVASEDKPRLGLTPATLAARVRQMQQLRARRDALWERAEKEEGPRKAETLMESLKLLGLGGSPGHENCYKFIHDTMKQADPEDASGCLRWLQFLPDPRCAPSLLNDANKLAGEGKFEEALAVVDRELKHPGNRRLDHDQIQRIMMGKYHIYRRWPGHEEQRLEVLRAIVDLDPNTYLGLGATGYLAMFFKTPTPVGVDYGWNAAQVAPGPRTWNITLGVNPRYDHPGKYCLRILHTGGKDSLKIRRVALLDGETVLCQSAPDAELAPGGKLEVEQDLKSWSPDRRLSLRLEVEASEAKTDVSGRFEIDPLL